MEIFELSLNISPFDLFSRIKPEKGWMFFDSALLDVPYSNYSILCVRPKFTFSYKDEILEISNNFGEKIQTLNPLDIIREHFYSLGKNFKSRIKSETFTSGIAGYLSYDFGMKLENVQSKLPESTNFPELFFSFFDSVLVYNHKTKRYTVFSENNPKDLLNFIFHRLEPPRKPLSQKLEINFKSNFSKDEYLQTIQRIKKYIEEGEVYQINFSHQFSAETDLSPIDIYSKLRTNNPAQFSALICVDTDYWIMSTSPELFIDLRENRVITKPIKGTIRRGISEDEDKSLKEKLLQSEKDSAELLMIVDLERNDLGKICKPGSVKVKALKNVETYSSVHHLVAEIEGILPEGNDIFDLIKAMFPGGSITGAPKRRSIQIIDEVEKTRRGVYTGSIGYIDITGNACFNIAIRTMIYDKGKLFLNLGGGIVYDSDPEKEYEETIQKGEAIFKSILKS
jgi:para-aminobenzoate synthetase component 1